MNFHSPMWPYFSIPSQTVSWLPRHFHTQCIQILTQAYWVLGWLLQIMQLATILTRANYVCWLAQKIYIWSMRLSGSHFLPTEANKHLVVVPSLSPEVDVCLIYFEPEFNLLYPDRIKTYHPKSLLTWYSMDKWLHSIHSFEEDDWTEIGLIWEIVKTYDSNQCLWKIYCKC